MNHPSKANIWEEHGSVVHLALNKLLFTRVVMIFMRSSAADIHKGVFLLFCKHIITMCSL